jgi:tryptophan-rich sensory protein
MLFDSNRLNAIRYVAIGGAVLPMIGIPVASYMYPMSGKDGSKVNGRPPARMFGIIWTLLVMLWSFSIVVASFRFDETFLILIEIFSIITLFMAIQWLRLWYKKRKNTAAQVLGLTTLFSFLMVVTSLSASTDMEGVEEAEVKGVVSLCLSPLFVWASVATLLNFFEINR